MKAWVYVYVCVVHLYMHIKCYFQTAVLKIVLQFLISK